MEVDVSVDREEDGLVEGEGVDVNRMFSRVDDPKFEFPVNLNKNRNRYIVYLAVAVLLIVFLSVITAITVYVTIILFSFDENSSAYC